MVNLPVVVLNVYRFFDIPLSKRWNPLGLHLVTSNKQNVAEVTVCDLQG